MFDDLRSYNYYNDEPLITKMSQAKEYFDSKFSNIHVEADLTEISKEIKESKDEIAQEIKVSKSEIIDAIDDSKPCLCHLATKEDVCKAKCQILGKIEESKNEINTHIDEKFVNLNDLIK